MLAFQAWDYLGALVGSLSPLNRPRIHLDNFPEFSSESLWRPFYFYRDAEDEAHLGETGCRARREEGNFKTFFTRPLVSPDLSSSQAKRREQLTDWSIRESVDSSNGQMVEVVELVHIAAKSRSHKIADC